MTDGGVAMLDQGNADLEEALSSANAYWADARREASTEQYLRPHEEARGFLRSQLGSLLTASDQARVAAGNVNLAVASANNAHLESEEGFSRARAQMAEAESASRAALNGAEAAARVHADAIRLAEEANTTAP